MSIKENYKKIRAEIPEEVRIVAAAKTRSADEIKEIIEAGVVDIGHNYVQEAERTFDALGEMARKATWHMIGPLQTNKINKALKVFDVIQTVDSLEQAEAINKRVEAAGKKKVNVLIEVNTAEENAKAGTAPEFESVKTIAEKIAELHHLHLEGLMTMGPLVEDVEAIRPYFKAAKHIFDKINDSNLPGVSLKTLSMGMSDSYKVAIEEGANMIRLGTVLFGPRKCS